MSEPDRTITNSKLMELSASAMLVAGQLWDSSKGGVPRVKLRELGNVCDFRATVQKRMFSPPDELMDNFLQEAGGMGIHDFRFHSAGSNTVVFYTEDRRERQVAIRVSDEFQGHTRPCNPLMLQPYKVFKKDAYLIEVLPLVPIVLTGEPEDFPPAQNRTPEIDNLDFEVFRALVERALSDKDISLNDGPLRDIGILPNGTLIFVDPGEMHAAEGTSEAAPGLSGVFNCQRDNNLGEPLIWVRGDGTWMQDVLLPNPFGPTNRPGLEQRHP